MDEGSGEAKEHCLLLWPTGCTLGKNCALEAIIPVGFWGLPPRYADALSQALPAAQALPSLAKTCVHIKCCCTSLQPHVSLCVLGMLGCLSARATAWGVRR